MSNHEALPSEEKPQESQNPRSQSDQEEQVREYKLEIVRLNKGLANYYARDDVFPGFGVVTAVEHNRAVLALVEQAETAARINTIKELHDSIMGGELEWPKVREDAWLYATVHKWLDELKGVSK